MFSQAPPLKASVTYPQRPSLNSYEPGLRVIRVGNLSDADKKSIKATTLFNELAPWQQKLRTDKQSVYDCIPAGFKASRMVRLTREGKATQEVSFVALESFDDSDEFSFLLAEVVRPAVEYKSRTTTERGVKMRKSFYYITVNILTR